MTLRVDVHVKATSHLRACLKNKYVCVLFFDGELEVSFVNSICTIRGGTHVTHVSDQIVEEGKGVRWREITRASSVIFWVTGYPGASEGAEQRKGERRGRCEATPREARAPLS